MRTPFKAPGCSPDSFQENSGGGVSVFSSTASAEAIASRMMAASRTVRVIGPAVSCDFEIGIIPNLLTSPTVGFTPTTLQTDDGETMDPLVSVPIAATQRLAETATAEPELEPDGLRSSAYGLCVCRPLPLQPLEDVELREFAHSLQFVLRR